MVVTVVIGVRQDAAKVVRGHAVRHDYAAESRTGLSAIRCLLFSRTSKYTTTVL